MRKARCEGHGLCVRVCGWGSLGDVFQVSLAARDGRQEASTRNDMCLFFSIMTRTVGKLG